MRYHIKHSIEPGTTVHWDDLRFPFTQTKRGSNDLPNFDYTDLGLLFPQNDATEKIYIIAQLPRHYEEHTGLRPHIHYIQDETEVPVFKMDYRWYRNGDAVPESFTTLSTEATPVFEYSSGSILQILSFPEIEPISQVSKASSFVDIIVYRDDNVVTGDLLAKEFDIHYRIDSLGSEQEFIK